MNGNQNPKNRVKPIAAIAGAAAVIVAGALTVAFDGGGSEHTNVLAGSGNAPANTTYRQPSVAAMSMGATASAPETPATTPEIAYAKPVIKAGG
jgi:hypothetical protein